MSRAIGWLRFDLEFGTADALALLEHAGAPYLVHDDPIDAVAQLRERLMLPVRP